jgi:hypothetical protein
VQKKTPHHSRDDRRALSRADFLLFLKNLDGCPPRSFHIIENLRLAARAILKRSSPGGTVQSSTISATVECHAA